MNQDCICQGNKAMKDLQHMRGIARKAAALDDEIYVITKKGSLYAFCQENEYTEDKGTIVEYIYP